MTSYERWERGEGGLEGVWSEADLPLRVVTNVKCTHSFPLWKCDCWCLEGNTTGRQRASRCLFWSVRKNPDQATYPWNMRMRRLKFAESVKIIHALVILLDLFEDSSTIFHVETCHVSNPNILNIFCFIANFFLLVLLNDSSRISHVETCL